MRDYVSNLILCHRKEKPESVVNPNLIGGGRQVELCDVKCNEKYKYLCSHHNITDLK